MRPTRRTFTATAAALAAATSVRARAVKPLYKDAKTPIPARVDDLIARMTLDEKIAQMVCIWKDKAKIQNARGDFVPASATTAFPDGFGMIARPQNRTGMPMGQAGDVSFSPNRDATETATYINAVQKWAIEQTRLGIPVLMHEESLHGYVAKDSTSFPQAIGIASSFDPDMATAIFSVAAREMRARGATVALAPVVDVARDPRWGRIEETYGEDPHLCGVMGKAAVLGFQGDTLPLAHDKVFATLKHMTGHGQPENGTNAGPAEIGERTLRETFFPPFEKIVTETNIRCVMPSYNEIDGIPSHANRWLLTTVLRDEWGFKGATVSDYFAINEMVTRHYLAADTTEAAFRAVRAGVDIETPDPLAYPKLRDLIQADRLTEADLDAPVKRILTMKFEAGLFDTPYVDARAAEGLTATPASVALARRAATRTPVLLKNNGLLPLDSAKVGRLLVLGTHAKDTPLGGYSNKPRHVVSVLEGLQAEGAAHGFDVAYSEGVRITDSPNRSADLIQFTPPEVNAQLITAAVEAAKTADTIVMVLGDNEQTSREGFSETHLGDRDSLDLIGQQNDLAAAIFALGKPTVVLLLNGRPLSVNLLNDHADALMEGWYMGQETGHAAADLLFGRANPGGKLPVSIPRNVGQLPVYYNDKPTARRGYLDGATTPLYPFGYGLSYTRFDLSAPRLSRTTIAVRDTVQVFVDVANIGPVAGDEVVQLYIRDDISSVTRPVLELKGFKRVTLAPGEKQTVTFDITPADLQFYDTDMRRVVEPGTFTIHAGASSTDLKSVVLTVVDLEMF